jgi:hypothetical protein
MKSEGTGREVHIVQVQRRGCEMRIKFYTEKLKGTASFISVVTDENVLLNGLTQKVGEEISGFIQGNLICQPEFRPSSSQPLGSMEVLLISGLDMFFILTIDMKIKLFISSVTLYIGCLCSVSTIWSMPPKYCIQTWDVLRFILSAGVGPKT